MPTFLTEPQWYDQSGQLVGPETLIANSAKSLQALSGSIFGDVPLRGNTTDAQGEPSQLPGNRQASPMPIYILPRITAVQNDVYFPESDSKFFYAMILNYIALNCQTKVDGKTKIKEGIYVGVETPASRQTVIICVYPEYNATVKVEVPLKNGGARLINVPGWSHGVAFTLGGGIETFGTESVAPESNNYEIQSTTYSYNDGIKQGNLIPSDGTSNIGAANNKFDKVYANSFVGNADTATAASTATGVQIGADRYAIYVSGSTMTFKKENS